MNLDNCEEINRLLNNMLELFINLDNTKKQLDNEINNKNAIQEDYLHELELANLSRLEINSVAKQLIKTRRERRELKQKMELISTLKGYADKYISKGIIADTKQAICNIDTLKKNQENRQYIPRVIKDLKCAKKELK